MKKLLFLCSLISLFSLVFAGCGADAQNSNQPVTLRYALWDQNQAPAMQQIITAFKKTHPNIDVKLEVTAFAQYFTKLQTAATGGNAPDVFWMNAVNFTTYASNGILMPLDDKIASDKVSMDNYPSSLVNLYTYNGKHYAMPKDFDTIGLWYNKSLFDAAGMKYPDDTWDWNTLRAAAKKLTNPAKGVWGIAAQLADQEGYYNTIPQNGGSVVSADKKSSGYNNPATVGGIEFWTDLLKDKSSPTLAQMTDTPALSMFESGKVAMMYTGSWNAIEFAQNSYTKDKVDVTVLPKGKVRATVIHGLGVAAYANTKYPTQAWEFVKFMGSKEAADISAQSGTIIPAYNGTQDAWVKAYPEFHVQTYLDEVAYSVPYPISTNTPEWQDMQTQVLTKVWQGQLTPEAGAQQVYTQMNQIMQKKQ